LRDVLLLFTSTDSDIERRLTAGEKKLEKNNFSASRFQCYFKVLLPPMALTKAFIPKGVLRPLLTFFSDILFSSIQSRKSRERAEDLVTSGRNKVECGNVKCFMGTL
jgi:hypothetical protein